MMKFFYKKESDFFIFFKNDRQILTQKKFPLLAQCENHSKKIIQQIYIKCMKKLVKKKNGLLK